MRSCSRLQDSGGNGSQKKKKTKPKKKKKTAWTDSLAQANHTDVPGSVTKVHEIHPVVIFPSVYFSDKKNRGYTRTPWLYFES